MIDCDSTVDLESKLCVYPVLPHDNTRMMRNLPSLRDFLLSFTTYFPTAFIRSLPLPTLPSCLAGYCGACKVP